jgi:hypothetical protein
MRSSAHEEGEVLVLRNPKVAAVGVVTNVFPTAYADVSKVWDHNSLPVRVLSRNDGRDIPFPIIPTNVWRAFQTFQGKDRLLMSKAGTFRPLCVPIVLTDIRTFSLYTSSKVTKYYKLCNVVTSVLTDHHRTTEYQGIHQSGFERIAILASSNSISYK